MRAQKIEYQDNGVTLEGVLVNDETVAGKKPGILICHDWSGRNEFAEKKAEKLAELGYIGFALDMFGKGVSGNTNDEKMGLIKPFLDDRNKLLHRIKVALEQLKKIPEVDTTRIGGIGFCFGGLCILDLARSGEDLRGVVAFHALFNAPATNANKKIKAKVLALHGHDDPMAPPEQVLAFEDEMTKAEADWQVHVYGNTKHAFTNPLAHDEKLGTVFNSLAEKRSWQSMKDFFAEVMS